MLGEDRDSSRESSDFVASQSGVEDKIRIGLAENMGKIMLLEAAASQVLAFQQG